MNHAPKTYAEALLLQKEAGQTWDMFKSVLTPGDTAQNFMQTASGQEAVGKATDIFKQNFGRMGLWDKLKMMLSGLFGGDMGNYFKNLSTAGFDPDKHGWGEAVTEAAQAAAGGQAKPEVNSVTSPEEVPAVQGPAPTAPAAPPSTLSSAGRALEAASLALPFPLSTAAKGISAGLGAWQGMTTPAATPTPATTPAPAPAMKTPKASVRSDIMVALADVYNMRNDLPVSDAVKKIASQRTGIKKASFTTTAFIQAVPADMLMACFLKCAEEYATEGKVNCTSLGKHINTAEDIPYSTVFNDGAKGSPLAEKYAALALAAGLSDADEIVRW